MDTGSQSFPNEPNVRSSEQQVLTVSMLNRQVAAILSRQFPLIWVRGEISNFTCAASGHCYFSLKDARAQVRAVLFRSKARAVPFELRNGLQVDAQAAVGLYEARGDFQLNIERMRPAGAGDLHQQFLALREKLQNEGLFDDALKRAPPPLPRAIGVVTSLQAAALRDVLVTLARRAPQVPVVIYPAPVQGADAAPQLVRALQTAGARAEVSTLLLVRGGGSLEDLWSFNDERLARAIRASPLPVVVGVGHESDVTIADFAADLRAPTAAATMATTDRAELLARTAAGTQALRVAMRRQLEGRAQRIDTAARLLPTPMERWYQWQARFDQNVLRLRMAQRQQLVAAQNRLSRSAGRLRGPSVGAAQARLEALSRRLQEAARQQLRRRTLLLDGVAAQLDLVDPGQVVRRGYAVVRGPQGELITSVAQAIPGTDWTLDLSDGQVQTTVRNKSA